jgi:hypothetical protein
MKRGERERSARWKPREREGILTGGLAKASSAGERIIRRIETIDGTPR